MGEGWEEAGEQEKEKGQQTQYKPEKTNGGKACNTVGADENLPER